METWKTFKNIFSNVFHLGISNGILLHSGGMGDFFKSNPNITLPSSPKQGLFFGDSPLKM